MPRGTSGVSRSPPFEENSAISGEKSPPFGIQTQTLVQAIAVVWWGDTPACEVRGSTARGGLSRRLVRPWTRGGSGFYGLEARFNTIAVRVTKGEPSSGHLRRNVAGRRGEEPMRNWRRGTAGFRGEQVGGLAGWSTVAGIRRVSIIQPEAFLVGDLVSI